MSRKVNMVMKCCTLNPICGRWTWCPDDLRILAMVAIALGVLRWGPWRPLCCLVLGGRRYWDNARMACWYVYSLGGVVLCTWHNDVIRRAFNCILLVNLDWCILFDIMFYVVLINRKTHSPVLLMLCCPFQVITLWEDQSKTTFSP